MNDGQYDSDFSQNYTQSYEDEEKEFLKSIVEVGDVLDNFEHRVLRGGIRYIDYETGKSGWSYPEKEFQMMNEIGIRELMSRIIGRISKVTRLTFKTDEEIYKDMFYFDMSLTELIAKRSDAWGLSLENAKAIKDASVELVWDCVSSSRNGFLAINLRSQYTRSDVSRNDQAATSTTKRSFLGIPLPSKR